MTIKMTSVAARRAREGGVVEPAESEVGEVSAARRPMAHARAMLLTTIAAWEETHADRRGALVTETGSGVVLPGRSNAVGREIIVEVRVPRLVCSSLGALWLTVSRAGPAYGDGISTYGAFVTGPKENEWDDRNEDTFGDFSVRVEVSDTLPFSHSCTLRWKAHLHASARPIKTALGARVQR